MSFYYFVFSFILAAFTNTQRKLIINAFSIKSSLGKPPVLLPMRNSFDNNMRQPITIHNSFLYKAY